VFTSSRSFERSAVRAEHSEMSKLVWIGVGIGVLVLLVSTTGFVLIVAHRRPSLSATTLDLSKVGDGHARPLGLGLLDLEIEMESIHSKGIKP
jgi:hypothetical protein